MVDVNAYKTKEKFVEAMQKLSYEINRYDPDVIIFPLRGAYPISDVLHMIDPSIHTYEKEYMPASSVIANTNEVIYKWTKNFIKEYYVPGDKLRFCTIDEVISGASVLRTSRQVRKALYDVIKEEGFDASNIEYKIFALEDTRGRNKQQRKYKMLKDKGWVNAVEVYANILMDRVELQPIKFKSTKEGRLPYIEKIEYTRNYVGLLKELAQIAGVDFNHTSLTPIAKVYAQERFLKND